MSVFGSPNQAAWGALESPPTSRGEDVQPVLDVKNLKVYYFTPRGPVKAVDGVDFNLARE